MDTNPHGIAKGDRGPVKKNIAIVRATKSEHTI